VDEAIYALHEDATPDLREYFHRYERPLVVPHAYFFKESFAPFIIWTAPTFAKRMEGIYDTLGIGGGGGGGGRYGGRFGGRESLDARGGGVAATMRDHRSNFRDTAWWNAHLKTGADGTSTVEFPFPDNLTAFRFTARGVTRDTRVGAVKQRAVVRKPFYVRLAAPRVLQEGNTLALSGLVHNSTDREQRVTADFRCPFPVVRSAVPDPWVLAPGAVGKAEYLVSVDRYLAAPELAFAAACEDGTADGLKFPVPGRRRGTPFQEGRSGVLAAGESREEVFRLTPGAVPPPPQVAQAGSPWSYVTGSFEVLP
jgi:hypothetical protein